MLRGPDVTDSRVHPLRGRDAELAALDRVLRASRSGHGAALVVSGAPGTGRSALLDTGACRTPHARVLRVRGAAAERGMPRAGLHQLLHQLAASVDELPAGLRERLRHVLDPDRSLAGALAPHEALHRILVDAAVDGPVVCCVDDAHHLDRDSLAALAFVARRVAEAPVVLLFSAERGHPVVTDGPLSEFPAVWVPPLADDSAEQLVTDRLGGALPPSLVERVLDLGRGNPLALVETVSTLTAEQLCGRAGPPVVLPRQSRTVRLVRDKLDALPSAARWLVVLAAVDDGMGQRAVDRAADGIGRADQALDDAGDAGLLTTVSGAIRPAEALVVPAVRAAVSHAELVEAHELLATCAADLSDACGYAWHRAALTRVPSTRTLRHLDRGVRDARRDGRHAQAAVTGERAAELSSDGVGRERRLLSAASDYWAAGRPRRALAALRGMPRRASDTSVPGQAATLAGEIKLRRGDPSVAATELRTVSRQLAHTDTDAAAHTLMLAGEASLLAGDDPRYCAMAEDAAELSGAGELATTRLVLDHFTAMDATFRGHHDEAAEPLRRVVRDAAGPLEPAGKILASQAAYTLGDAELARTFALEAVSHARHSGEPARVPWALMYAAVSALLVDKHTAALDNALEGVRLAESLGQRNCAVDHLTILGMHAALQGDGETAWSRLEAASAGSAERGLGRPGAFATWAAACTHLAADRPADALAEFHRMHHHDASRRSAVRVMAVPQFVEAAARCGQPEQAAEELRTYERWAEATGGPARRGLAHRCRALLAGDRRVAEEHFSEALRLHRTAGAVHDLASTELLFGPRLRRGRRLRQARAMLSEAVDVFHELGARHWARRAERELRECDQDTETGGGLAALSPQQERIAALVADGATSREVAAQLFISHRTVDHHLRNIFTRLDIRSRVELAKFFR